MTGPRMFTALVSAPLLFASVAAYGQVVVAPYTSSYTLTSIGTPPGVPTKFGGITIGDDPNVLLVAGAANNAAGAVYRVPLTRDADGHVSGFQGTATLLATTPSIDGGLDYGPGGVLFYTRYPANEIGQVLPGSAATDKVVKLTPLGVRASVGALQFVPEGFPGAGRLKVLTYTNGDWNDVTFVPDATGTYDLTVATRKVTLGVGPEGLAYVPLGSPEFPTPSIVVCEYVSGTVSSYQIDTNGDPIVGTRRVMIASLGGAEGAVVDPLTNDLLVGTLGGRNQIVVVRGFAAPVVDSDGDGVNDPDDNCLDAANADQLDTDGDAAGDACDDDDDGDGWADVDDAFPTDPTEHVDTDGDGVGDVADACPLDRENDGDGDGLCAGDDDCPAVFDPDQSDFDGDGLGDLCDADWDGDGVSDDVDLCIGFDDAIDADGDRIPDGPDATGHACDICPHDAENDADVDGRCADADNCPVDDNPDQGDLDADGAGDACDADDDGDGSDDAVDAFPRDPSEWSDGDLDGVGDNADLCLGSDAAGDTDLDGACDDLDALPLDPTETSDVDGDGVGDNADLFDGDPTEWADADLDGVGDNADACAGDDATGDTDADLRCDDIDLCPTDPLDADLDGDLVCDVVDACLGGANVDSDGDQTCDDLDLCTGNDATGDSDADGLCDANDNCAVDANPDQADSDGDAVGDACEGDTDQDGVLDDDDDCVAVYDPDQADNDLDGAGDACDDDDDNDSVVDAIDNCSILPNADQGNLDGDAFGDACDFDDDADGVLDGLDLCPATPRNVLFDANGCSGVQRVTLTCGTAPCTSLWSQVRYVACVIQSSTTAHRMGLLTSRERTVLVRRAALSCWCGG